MRVRASAARTAGNSARSPSVCDIEKFFCSNPKGPAIPQQPLSSIFTSPPVAASAEISSFTLKIAR